MIMRAYIGEVLKGMKHKKAKEILLEKIIDNIPEETDGKGRVSHFV